MQNVKATNKVHRRERERDTHIHVTKRNLYTLIGICLFVSISCVFELSHQKHLGPEHVDAVDGDRMRFPYHATLSECAH